MAFPGRFQPPLLLLLLVLVVAPPPSAAQPQAGGFPMAGYTPSRTYVAPFAGPEAAATVAWSQPLAGAGALGSALALSASGTLFVGSYNGTGSRLFALNTNAGGAVMWSVGAGGNVGGAPAVASDGSVYFSSDAPALHKVSPQGVLLWSFAARGAAGLVAPLLAPDGSIFFGAISTYTCRTQPTAPNHPPTHTSSLPGVYRGTHSLTLTPRRRRALQGLACRHAHF